MSDEIVVWPAKVLNSPTQPVTDFGPDLHALLERMRQAQLKAEGIGIAANQIGVPLRACLVGVGAEQVEMINPEIKALSGEASMREGCLSVPGEVETVQRATQVTVTWQDRNGQRHEATYQDRMAHIVQHEVDHLNGMVYVERLSALKRDLLRRKMLKRR